MRPFPERADLWLLLVAAACGVLFVASLGSIWPLVDTDLNADGTALERGARVFLAEERGFDLDGYRSASRMWVNGPALDWVESAFGQARAQAWIRDGLPLARYFVYFKKRGEVVWYVVDVHAEAGVQGWWRWTEEDEAGARLDVEEARGLVRAAIADSLRLDPADWQEKAVSTDALPERTDHRFTFERILSEEPELRERLRVTVAGERVIAARRSVPVPPAAEREARAAEAPERVLQTVGFALLALAALAAFFEFLWRLRDGTVRLGRAVFWPAVIFVCLIGTYLLQPSLLFLEWEPLWPRWVSSLQYLVQRTIFEQWMLLALLAVIAAGDALDRAGGFGRGESLWALSRGRLGDPAVGAASLRGFLVGLVCGAALAGSVLTMQQLLGAEVRLQPRAFFFYAINASSPSAITLLFFLNVALVEELGYRFFGGTWFLQRTGRRWVAIAVPAIVYGLTHTGLGFLPPAEPFWGRALALTLVGCVWGWAFLRYDALTVVLSHYTADLFIFNWPRLASGESGPTLAAAATIAVPLLPGLVWLLRRAALSGPGPRANARSRSPRDSRNPPP